LYASKGGTEEKEKKKRRGRRGALLVPKTALNLKSRRKKAGRREKRGKGVHSG